jgi:two-component system chemotaxis response regulator CheY
MKIAIVDDALVIRMQLKRFFAEVLKYEVVAEGADGNEAIKIFAEKTPDLMTLDLTMPNKSGLEALREIMQANPQARVIVISALQEEQMRKEALGAGAKGFIEKPLKMNDAEWVKQLTQTIEKILS